MSEKKSAITGLNEQEEEKLCEEEEELTELDELTMDIVAVVAYNTAACFEKMVHEMNQDSINNISRIIESMSEDNLVDLLKAMFIISDMEYAAEALDVVHVCAGYCELAYLFFEECLFDTDIMDWYLVESWFDEWERHTFVDIANALGVTADELLSDSILSDNIMIGDKIAELLNGCGGYEKNVILEVVAALRNALRSNGSDLPKW